MTKHSYAGWLRTLVGHALLILPGATGIVRDAQGRVLLQKRRDNGLWGLPGGGQDVGESIADTARREVREEVGLEVEPSRLVHILTCPQFDFTLPNGDRLQPFMVSFECDMVGGTLEPQESEVLDVDWFAVDRLPAMTPLAGYVLGELGQGTRLARFDQDDGAPMLPPGPGGIPEYVRWLRGYVGHEKLILPAGAALIRDERGRVLLQKRRDNALWGFAGGMQERGESITQAVRREVFEEMGLIVEPRQLVGVYSSPQFDRTYENGDAVQVFITFFECVVMGGKLRPQESEVLEVGWFDLEDLPPMTPCCAVKAADAQAFRGEAFFR